MLGAMWPDYHSAFPDWLDETEKTTEWWIQEFVDFHKQVKRAFPEGNLFTN
jgi:hypothetical protein